MELWTIIHKDNGTLIRCGKRPGNSEFGIEWYFTTNEYLPYWFTETKLQAQKSLINFVHPQYSINYSNPSTDRINIEDYEIIKFENKYEKQRN